MTKSTTDIPILDDDAVATCPQCEANARWDEAGGYNKLAAQCREYCRRGHKEQEQEAKQ